MTDENILKKIVLTSIIHGFSVKVAESHIITVF